MQPIKVRFSIDAVKAVEEKYGFSGPVDMDIDPAVLSDEQRAEMVRCHEDYGVFVLDDPFPGPRKLLPKFGTPNLQAAVALLDLRIRLRDERAGTDVPQVPAVTGKKAPCFEENIKKQKTRDKSILKFLAAGPSTLDHIHLQLFKNAEGRPLALHTAQIRLDKLVSMNYIKKQRYDRVASYRGLTMYALDKLGKNDACTHFPLNRDLIRTEFPMPDRVAHEIFISDMVRTIWREVEEKKYGLESIFDDREMKRQYSRKHSKDGVNPMYGNKKSAQKVHPYYPDLVLTVIENAHNGRRIKFNMELDSGNKGPNYWKPKIASWPDPTLVVTLNQQRLEILKGYVVASNRRQPTGFALVSQFIKYGLRETEWYWLPSDTRSTLADANGKAASEATKSKIIDSKTIGPKIVAPQVTDGKGLSADVKVVATGAPKESKLADGKGKIAL
jgi:hypothetical protein